MGCGKWTGLVAVRLLLHLFAVIAEPAGFLSIDCGGKTNRTENNITWVTDTNFIDVGQAADAQDGSLQPYLQSLRFFPKPLNKSCYQLPVQPDVPYLVRLWFALGNYSGYDQLPKFAFSIETVDMLTVKNLTMSNHDPVNNENILFSSGRVLYICLIRTSETHDDPFISAIELRTLQVGMYPHAKPGTMLNLNLRRDLGGQSLVRYPQDAFDRLWSPDVDSLPEEVTVGSTTEHILTNNTQDFPPTIVMQTAWLTSGNTSELPFNPIPSEMSGSTKSLLLLYSAEIEPLNGTETGFFEVWINLMPFPNAVTVPQNQSALEVQVPVDETISVWELVTTRNGLVIIINAFEYYMVVVTDPPTYPQDIQALDAIKSTFGIKGWISDPCYVTNWEGISCDKNGSPIRISEIDLSGKNLTGLVPENITQLTGLVELSLENNHLNGNLPNFSNLTMLERLHLQNNNFSGSIPDWLGGLKNLKELFIDNNNFSGVIPAQLLSKHSLNLTYSGNRYLHIPSNSSKDKLRLILGMTLSGNLVIVLFVIVGIVVHRKKSGRKDSSRVEKESKHVLGQENTMIIVRNKTMSRAFTLEEIMAATENFSQKIGEGGFGSVFFGKLEKGKDIAVKVLSRFSKQGVQEFVNEIDLLSKIHHKNLVPLLGYCNESREHMLVYEHMSRGSLKDHLYGPSAELSQLNWKTRLKIALDAAQGLQYLHVGCRPKIIHRDIKTSNILLDSNFNAKLADFGLSRMAMDGETSHVITTVKGTLAYMDPEYFSTQMLTDKSDVYSFGVVLLEIICGRQPINAELPGGQLNLIRWVTPYVEMDENEDKMAEIIDKRLGTDYDIKSITSVAKLAIRCVQAEPSFRPTVNEVVAQLKAAVKLDEDKVFLISEIDIEYGDLGASLACSSIDFSGPKGIDWVEINSNLAATLQQK